MNLAIIYGSRGGNAQACAQEAGALLTRYRLRPRILPMPRVTTGLIERIDTLLVCVSTFGKGAPPAPARELHQFLSDAPPMGWGHLQFSVCGLGDRSYPLFCQCGKDFDALLAKHSAHRLADRADCDADYELDFRDWLNRVTDVLLGQQIADRGVLAGEGLTSVA